jgi:DNA (cytosine-5)-methyltransferase 1
MLRPSSIEICAGGGGQALGVEQSGFDAQALIEIDASSCETLKFNRSDWNVIQGNVREFDASKFKGIDLFAGGVPCPPFSIAGKQLGQEDERDLFPQAIRMIDECRPKAVMLENVRGFLGAVFEDYRRKLKDQLESMGYFTTWNLLNASDFGVSQLRPRVVIVALQKEYKEHFSWPFHFGVTPPTVGELLYKQMAERGWRQVDAWKERANDIAPTIVGGSKKHGGGDLGPTRAKQAWAALGVNGKSIADEAPDPDFVGIPRLTIPMTAHIQGFPHDWKFQGKKTPAYRQVGNAFPPPVAHAVSSQILSALTTKTIVHLAS